MNFVLRNGKSWGKAEQRKKMGKIMKERGRRGEAVVHSWVRL
jgi:uncharacterized protein YheU (UPF0270 family)